MAQEKEDKKWAFYSADIYSLVLKSKKVIINMGSNKNESGGCIRIIIFYVQKKSRIFAKKKEFFLVVFWHFV